MNDIDKRLAKMAREMNGKKVRKWLYDKVYDQYDEAVLELAQLRVQLSGIEQANDIANQGMGDTRSRHERRPDA